MSQVELDGPGSPQQGAASWRGEEQEVLITYCNEFNTWEYMEQDFLSRLPFRNVQWRSTTGRQRVIDQLDVTLVPFTKDCLKLDSVANLYTLPLLHLYIVLCDDQDTYKNYVKQQISNYTNLFLDKQDYMIVYVTQQDKMQKAQFKLRGSVFDKIKADFSGKNERCVELQLGSRNNDTWDQFLNRVLENLLHSFKRRVERYEEDLRKMMTNRMVPGWNYCQFFILKEGLAFAFEGMHLYEEALLQYDELDAVFAQYESREANEGKLPMAWFPEDLGRRDMQLLNIDKLPYRDMINSNTISVFDLRIYLFARQCLLLFRMNKPLAGTRRAYAFIDGFSKKLVANQTIELRKARYVETWVYCSATEMVEVYEMAMQDVNPDYMDDNEIRQYLLIMADLRDIARKKLDKLGVAYKLLPPLRPFCNIDPKVDHKRRRRSSLLQPMASLEPDDEGGQSGGSLAVPPSRDQALRQTDGEELSSEDEELLNWVAGPMAPDVIGNPMLRQALKTEDDFDELYIELSEAAIENYSAAHRVRRANLVHRDLGALHFYRKRYLEAEPHFYEVCDQYVRDSWRQLELDIRSDLAHCQRKCRHFQKYVESCTALVTRMCPLPAEEKDFYYKDMLVVCHKELTEPTGVWFEPLLEVEAPFLNLKNPMRDGFIRVGEEVSFFVHISNEADQPLHCEAVSLTLQLVEDEPELEPEEDLIGEDGFKILDVYSVPNMFSVTEQQTISNKTHLSFVDAGVAPDVPDTINKEPFMLTLENTVLVPGVNELEFVMTAPYKGRFQFVDILAEVGMLHLKHEYDYLDVEYVLDVESGMATISMDVDIQDESVFLSGVPQTVPIVIRTHEHAINGGVLSFAPNNGLVLTGVADDAINIAFEEKPPTPEESSTEPKTENGTSGKTPTENGEISKPEFSPEAEVEKINQTVKAEREVHEEEEGVLSIRIPPCPANHKMTLGLVVASPSVLSSQCLLEFRLIYTKATLETFKVVASLPLSFYSPLSASHQPTVIDRNTAYLQATLKAHLPASIRIVHFQLQSSAPVTITSLPANDLVKEQPLRLNQTADFLWKATTPEGLPEDLECTLVVDYAVKTNAGTSRYSYSLNYQLPRRLYSADCVIRSSAVEEARGGSEPILVVGQFAELQVTLTCAGDEGLDNGVVALLQANPRHWMVSGRDKALFLPKKESRALTYTVRLLPLVAGYIPLPTITLRQQSGDMAEIPDTMVEAKDRARQVHVLHRPRNLPPLFVTTGTA
eukprot:comp20470_c0_seq1/m.26083 comp20470_c0_seq1/g.26083  ORF comp20470_c0_seq1/g.26083 comp20470_c0_seq1/m.26083 type:complete len:1249 (-) comp20470_c0_seq1:392-4138(-)